MHGRPPERQPAAVASVPSLRPEGLKRRTRRADRWTDLFLTITVLFSIWAAGLLVLAAAGIAPPVAHYTDATTALKAGFGTAVALIAVGQVYTMEATMGHLPRGPLKVGTLMRVHRWGGRIALSLALVTAYLCLANLGAPTDYLRQAVHGVLGATAIEAIALKFALIRFRPRLAFAVAPWLGRYAASAFVLVWLSSAVAYSTGQL